MVCAGNVHASENETIGAICAYNTHVKQVELWTQFATGL